MRCRGEMSGRERSGAELGCELVSWGRGKSAYGRDFVCYGRDVETVAHVFTEIVITSNRTS